MRYQESDQWLTRTAIPNKLKIHRFRTETSMTYVRTRRHVQVVQILVCVGALATVSWSADYGKVTTSKVAEGVYLLTTAPYGDVGFGGNSVAIITDEGVVMFDTSGTPATGQTIL